MEDKNLLDPVKKIDQIKLQEERRTEIKERTNIWEDNNDEGLLEIWDVGEVD